MGILAQEISNQTLYLGSEIYNAGVGLFLNLLRAQFPLDQLLSYINVTRKCCLSHMKKELLFYGWQNFNSIKSNIFCHA